MEERRKSPRQRVLKVARIRFPGGAEVLPCIMRDISEGGAQLLFSTLNGIPSEFRLETDEHSERNCFVRWRQTNSVGVVFLTAQEATLRA